MRLVLSNCVLRASHAAATTGTQLAKRRYWRLREAAALPYDAALMLVSRG